MTEKRWNVGDFVKHPQHGEGTVLSWAADHAQVSWERGVQDVVLSSDLEPSDYEWACVGGRWERRLRNAKRPAEADRDTNG